MALKSVRNPDALEKEIENGRLLVEAATAGNVAVISELLRQGTAVNADAYIRTLFYKSQNYLTPLQCAALHGHADCVQTLLAEEADLDACDRYDTTAVHMAAENGHLQCLRILLDAGANCNMGTKYSKPGSYTVHHVGGTRALHLATMNNHSDCVKELMLNGADYNATDELGRTSLYLAAQFGFEDCLTTHLRNAIGRDILSLPVKDTGETPLHECVRHTMTSAIRELLKHGSDVNHCSACGNTPLLLAVHNREQFSFEVVRQLVRYGYNTDVNKPDSRGLTPLHFVSFSEHAKMDRRPEVAAFLIAYGADFTNLKNKNGVLLLQQEVCGTYQDDIILRALVRCMTHLPLLPQLYMRKMNCNPLRRERNNWYMNLRNSPRTLQHYSRCVVRKALGPQRLRQIRTLPLPRPLQEFLLLDFETIT